MEEAATLCYYYKGGITWLDIQGMDRPTRIALLGHLADFKENERDAANNATAGS